MGRLITRDAQKWKKIEQRMAPNYKELCDKGVGSSSEDEVEFEEEGESGGGSGAGRNRD